MKIAVIGVGNVGSALAERLAAAKHEVILGVRTESADRHRDFATRIGASIATPERASALVDAILLATPWPATEGVIRQLGSLEGKLLIDATNPIKADFSGLEDGPSGAERVASWAPKAHVVKCFNQVGFEVMKDPSFGGRRSVMFVAGDDRGACEKVAQLSEAVGFETVQVGALALARQLEQLAWLWIHLAIKKQQGRDWGFSIVRR